MSVKAVSKANAVTMSKASKDTPSWTRNKRWFPIGVFFGMLVMACLSFGGRKGPADHDIVFMHQPIQQPIEQPIKEGSSTEQVRRFTPLTPKEIRAAQAAANPQNEVVAHNAEGTGDQDPDACGLGWTRGGANPCNLTDVRDVLWSEKCFPVQPGDTQSPAHLVEAYHCARAIELLLKHVDQMNAYFLTIGLPQFTLMPREGTLLTLLRSGTDQSDTDMDFDVLVDNGLTETPEEAAQLMWRFVDEFHVFVEERKWVVKTWPCIRFRSMIYMRGNSVDWTKDNPHKETSHKKITLDFTFRGFTNATTNFFTIHNGVVPVTLPRSVYFPAKKCRFYWGEIDCHRDPLGWFYLMTHGIQATIGDDGAWLDSCLAKPIKPKAALLSQVRSNRVKMGKCVSQLVRRLDADGYASFIDLLPSYAESNYSACANVVRTPEVLLREPPPFIFDVRVANLVCDVDFFLEHVSTKATPLKRFPTINKFDWRACNYTRVPKTPANRCYYRRMEGQFTNNAEGKPGAWG